MNRRDLVILALSTALLGIGILRVLSPGASATRRISVEAITIPSVSIKSDASLEQSTSWTAPDDVYVVGWAPTVGAPAAHPEVHLLAGDTTIFSDRSATVEGLRPTFLPSGTGFLVRKGETLRLQQKMKNSGPDGETQGARALIYFHPVAFR
jgi:hypothetical protein